MHRRAVLRVGGTIGAALLGGCSGGTQPTGQSTPGSPETLTAEPSEPVPVTVSTPTASDPTPGTLTPAATHRGRLTAYLDRAGITVRRLRVVAAESLVDLRYVTAKADYQDLGAEIGTIAGGFFREVERGWDVDRLNATVLSVSGAEMAYWHAQSAWLAAYRNGEITGDELSLRILQTLERAE